MIKLRDSNWVSFPPKLNIADIPQAAYRLLNIDQTANHIKIRRKAKWIVGKTVVAGTVVEVPSPVPAGVLLPLLLYGDGVKLDIIASLPPSLFINRSNEYSELLAHCLLSEVRKNIGSDAAKQYVKQRERTRLIKGRPIWMESFGRHPSAGVVCTTFEISTDTLMNRLIGAAITQATRIVRSNPKSHRLGIQLSEEWRHIADFDRANIEDFNKILTTLGRLHERYRTSLILARSLLMRLDIDPFHHGTELMPSVVVNLSDLLERVVTRLIKDSLKELPEAYVTPQSTDRESFFDGNGMSYRSIRPDLIVGENGKPLIVIDSKFKPAYAPAGVIENKNLVSTGDLFQLAFYQSRLQQKYGLEKPPRSVIVAPQLNECAPAPLSRCIIRWGITAEGFTTQLIPLPLSKIVGAIRNGEPADSLVCCAPRLASLLVKVFGEGRLPNVMKKLDAGMPELQTPN